MNAPTEEMRKMPVMVIEVYDAHRRVQAQHRLVGADASCKIGRDVGCDIVLDDAYAAAEHTVLRLQEDGRVRVTDLQSRNGTRVGERRLSADSVVIEDEVLIVGRTRIRVRTGHSPLAPEKLFRRDLIQRYRTSLALTGVGLLLAFIAFNEWRQASEQLLRDALVACLLALGILGAWIGICALVTRVSHGAWTLRLHVAIAANAAAIVLWSSWLLGLVSFAFGWTWLEIPFGIVAATALLGALYLHLLKATHLNLRTAAAIAVFVPLCLGGLALWLSQDADSRNVNRLSLGNTLFPPGFRVESASDLDDYLAELPDLKRSANRARQRSLAENPLVD